MLKPSTTPVIPPSGRCVATFAILCVAVLLSSCGAVDPNLDVDSGPTVAAHVSASAFTQSPGCSSGVQSSGALYEICIPEIENTTGTLVVYAQGLSFPQLDLQIREQEGGINVEDFVTSRGFAYAATSYYTNGLVEPEKGAKDLRELIVRYRELHGQPARVLLLSFSNGALLSMLALEKEAHLFDGALASCGPHGSYVQEIQYLGDIAVLFDFFFQEVEVIPGLGFGLPGGPDGIPQALIAGLSAAAPPGFTAVDVLAQRILTALQDHPDETGQLLGAIQLTSDISRGNTLFASSSEGVELVIRAVAYNVFVTNDALAKLGGRFFDNTSRVYGDLLPDALRQTINGGIMRYEADRHVTSQLESRYESKGHLRTPVIALHNTRDPLVPFWQEALYLSDLASRSSNYTLVPIEGYGHCNFTTQEVADGLDALVEAVGAPVVAEK